MGDLTDVKPKSMLEVSGIPVLAHKIKMLPRSIEEVILVVGYKREYIIEYFGEEWDGRKIRYATQEKLDGTAGAIHMVKDMLHDRFLVTMGDDLYHTEDLERMLQYPLAILGYYVEDASQFGIMTKDENGNLKDVVERPHGFKDGLVNTGAYVLDMRFFEYKPVQITEREFGLPQTLAIMAKDIPVKVEEATRWHPVGNPDELRRAEEFLEHISPSSL